MTSMQFCSSVLGCGIDVGNAVLARTGGRWRLALESIFLSHYGPVF
jgi:hypothetical protein